MRISDWSSDVCSSDLSVLASIPVILIFLFIGSLLYIFYERPDLMAAIPGQIAPTFQGEKITVFMSFILSEIPPGLRGRSKEHTSELQSPMRSSYAVFCTKQTKTYITKITYTSSSQLS